jgi:hypothetical protein
MMESGMDKNDPRLASVLEEYLRVQKALENYSESEQAEVRALGIRVKEALRSEPPSPHR